MIVSIKILNIFHALKYFTLGPGISKASLYDRVLICQKWIKHNIVKVKVRGIRTVGSKKIPSTVIFLISLN